MRPLLMGPIRLKRGAKVPMCGPPVKSTPGIKSVAE